MRMFIGVVTGVIVALVIAVCQISYDIGKLQDRLSVIEDRATVGQQSK